MTDLVANLFCLAALGLGTVTFGPSIASGFRALRAVVRASAERMTRSCSR